MLRILVLLCVMCLGCNNPIYHIKSAIVLEVHPLGNCVVVSCESPVSGERFSITCFDNEPIPAVGEAWTISTRFNGSPCFGHLVKCGDGI